MSNKKNTGLTRRASGLMALEQRFMFDGAAVADALQVVEAQVVLADVAEAVKAVEPLPLAVAQVQQQAQQKIIDYLKGATDQQIFELFNGGKDAPDAAWADRLAQLRDVLNMGELPVQFVAMDQASQFTAVAAFTMNGPDGKPTIFVNPYWTGLLDNQDMTLVVVEELGHWMDQVLNKGADTAGDEGERFAQIVTQGSAVLSADSRSNDIGWVQVDGVSYEVEFASFKFITAYRLAPESPRYEAEKEQESDRFLGQSLGVANINDKSSLGTFSGNDVVVELTIAGTIYNGWISRPIKDQGVVRGFYFWYDPSFTTFEAATTDGNQDSDSNSADNQGFILVVDQTWFNGVTSGTPIYNNGSINTNVYEVGSSSDRVDSALNGVVAASNTAPAVVADSQTISEGTPTATGNVLTNDSDLEGNTLRVTEFAINGQLYTQGTTATLTGVGSLVINANGTYTFTPVAGYTGSVPVATYKVSDGLTTANTALSITVTPVNSVPDAVDNTGVVTEDVVLTGNLITNDTDPDGDTLTVTGYTFTPSGGTIRSGVVGANTIIPGVGTLLIYSNGSYSFTPAPNYDGAVPVFTYTISDGNGGSDTATLTLTITGVPDGPTLTNDTSSSTGAVQAAIEDGGLNNATAGQNATGNVLSNDSPNPGLTVTFVGQTAATVSVATSSTSSNGSAVVGR